MAATAQKKTRETRKRFVNLTTRTVSMEKALLSRIETIAFSSGQSVSQWVRDAIVKRLSGIRAK